MLKQFSESLRLHDNYGLHPSQLMIAGPTCGKTTLIKKYDSIFDSDQVVEEFFPSWFTRGKSGDFSEIEYQAVAWMIRTVSGHNRWWWITNMWGKTYLDVLLAGKSSRKVPFFYRADPQEIQDLMAARGSSVHDLKQLKSWVQAHEKYAKAVSDKVYVLGKGEFLSDYVKLGQNG